LIAQGATNSAVAETLVISERTVERHVANIFAKLDLRSRAQIAVFAVETGLTPAMPKHPDARSLRQMSVSPDGTSAV
jgi:hypothetical protein